MPSNTEQRALRTWAAGFCVVTACLGSAQAQQVGSYVGPTSDGHEVTIDVALDVDTGQYYISDISSDFTFHCPKTDTDEYWWMGASGFNPPVDAGHADLLLRFTNFYLAASLDFKSDDKITGKIRGGAPEFADDRSPPKSGQACNSENLKFTAKFSPTGARGTPVTATHQVIARVDRNGRRVVEHSSAR